MTTELPDRPLAEFMLCMKFAGLVKEQPFSALLRSLGWQDEPFESANVVIEDAWLATILGDAVTVIHREENSGERLVVGEWGIGVIWNSKEYNGWKLCKSRFDQIVQAADKAYASRPATTLALRVKDQFRFADATQLGSLLKWPADPILGGLVDGWHGYRHISNDDGSRLHLRVTGQGDVAEDSVVVGHIIFDTWFSCPTDDVGLELDPPSNLHLNLDLLHRLSKGAFWDSLTENGQKRWLALFDGDPFATPTAP